MTFESLRRQIQLNKLKFYISYEVFLLSDWVVGSSFLAIAVTPRLACCFFCAVVEASLRCAAERFLAAAFSENHANYYGYRLLIGKMILPTWS